MTMMMMIITVMLMMLTSKIQAKIGFSFACQEQAARWLLMKADMAKPDHNDSEGGDSDDDGDSDSDDCSDNGC